MLRLTYIREVSSLLVRVFVVISVLTVKTTNTQLSFSPTACSRTTDLQTIVEITRVAFTHRFQVTSVLLNYPFRQELSEVEGEAFQTLANTYETEVVNELRKYDSKNKYDAVVFLFLPNGGTSQIKAVISAEDDKLTVIDLNEVLRRVSVGTNITELKNMESSVQDEVQYCLRESIIPPNGSLTWPTSPVGASIDTIELCPQGTQFAGRVALATRLCLPTPGCMKNPVTNMTKVCHGAWQTYQCNECFNMSVNPLLQQLSNMIVNPGANILLICEQALNLTNTADTLNAVGIESITIIAQFISDLSVISQQHLTCVTKLIGNVLLLSEDAISAAEERSRSATILLEALDDLLHVTTITDDVIVLTPSLALGLAEVDTMATGNQWYGFGSHTNDGILTDSYTIFDVSRQPDWTGGKDTFIYVRIDEQESSVTRAAYTLHQNDKFYQTASIQVNDLNIYQLNSRIISATTHNVISQPMVSVAFKVIDAGGVNQTCVSWVPTVDGSFGRWSPDGCSLDYITSDGPEGLTICKCDHFGSFALLATIQEIIPPTEVVSLLPIGAFVIIAAIFCFLAFTAVALIFALVSALRKQRELQILTFLFFDLAMFYLIFGIAINRTTPQVGCVFAAALMYLCLVSTFAWMAVSAGNSYEYSRQKYIQIKWFVRKAAILAFGIPMGLTIMLAVTNPYYFFDTQNRCFISGEPTIIMGAALLLPLAISILVTIVLLIASFISYPELQDSNMPTPRLHRLITRKKRLYMSAILSGVIFVTFVFLLLAIYISSVATQVIFGLVSMVQGLFVVWAYCYYDKEIRTAVVDAIKNTKPKVTESGKFQPYWSSSNWQQSNEVPGVQATNPPSRFLDAMHKPSSLTPQTFNPDSIPLTELEKKRLKITVNGDVVREAKLLENKASEPVTTGFSTQVVMEVNGNGYINPAMVIPEPDYSDEEDEANGFVQAEEVELVIDETKF